MSDIPLDQVVEIDVSSSMVIGGGILWLGFEPGTGLGIGYFAGALLLSIWALTNSYRLLKANDGR